MKFTAVAALFLATISPLVSAYPVQKADVVNCRSSPSSSGKVVKTYKINTEIKISCQASGESIKGNTLWDKTQDGCYVADYYIKTGKNGYVAGKCGGGSTGGGDGGSKPSGMKDDYPYKNNCGPVDKWNYFKCQCTSFVAWRVNSRLGLNFHNRYKGKAWGNAKTWSAAARGSGVTINGTPKVGAVAQTTAGRFGHVAWVAKVVGNNVVVEEYNKGGTERYGTRTVSKSAFNYIHLKN